MTLLVLAQGWLLNGLSAGKPRAHHVQRDTPDMAFVGIRVVAFNLARSRRDKIRPENYETPGTSNCMQQARYQRPCYSMVALPLFKVQHVQGNVLQRHAP